MAISVVGWQSFGSQHQPKKQHLAHPGCSTETFNTQSGWKWEKLLRLSSEGNKVGALQLERDLDANG